MLGSATGAAYRAALPHLLADPGVDAVIVLFVPPIVAGAEEVAEAVKHAVEAADADKPVLAVFVSAAGPPAALFAGPKPVAAFSRPPRQGPTRRSRAASPSTSQMRTRCGAPRSGSARRCSFSR